MFAYFLLQDMSRGKLIKFENYHTSCLDIPENDDVDYKVKVHLICYFYSTRLRVCTIVTLL